MTNEEAQRVATKLRLRHRPLGAASLDEQRLYRAMCDTLAMEFRRLALRFNAEDFYSHCGIDDPHPHMNTDFDYSTHRGDSEC